MNTKTAAMEAKLEFDPFSLEFRNSPSAYHSQLLNQSPGFMVMEGDIESAYVAKFDHCMQVLSNWELFSSLKPKNMPGMQKVDFFNGQPVMNYSDPPDHTRRRQVVNPAFSPGRVRDLLKATDKMIDELLEEFQPGQSICAVNDIGKPLALNLLFGEFLGVPQKYWHIFLEFGSTFPTLEFLKPGDPKPPAYVEAWKKGEATCRLLVEEAASSGKKNVLASLAAATEDGKMSDAEMMATMCVLFTGGVPTISAMSSSAVHYLAAYPEIAERIRQDQALAKPFAEETFRLDAPVTLVLRFCQEDTQVGDQIIKKGMPVYTMISVANRDPDMYENPTEFNIDRKGMRHLAFGNGTHVCVGNSIARMVVPLLVTKIANKFSNLKLDPTKESEWDTTARSRHRGTAPVIL